MDKIFNLNSDLENSSHSILISKLDSRSQNEPKMSWPITAPWLLFGWNLTSVMTTAVLSDCGYGGAMAPIGGGFWGRWYGEWRLKTHHIPPQQS